MSGGAWGYQSERIADMGRKVAEAMRLLGALEHELDWGSCGDTCLPCAEIRSAKALQQFFCGGSDDATLAISVLRDWRAHLCPECKAQQAKRSVE